MLPAILLCALSNPNELQYGRVSTYVWVCMCCMLYASIITSPLTRALRLFCTFRAAVCTLLALPRTFSRLYLQTKELLKFQSFLFLFLFLFLLSAISFLWQREEDAQVVELSNVRQVLYIYVYKYIHVYVFVLFLYVRRPVYVCGKHSLAHCKSTAACACWQSPHSHNCITAGTS